jgi:putative salt-induced outer membrane protein
MMVALAPAAAWAQAAPPPPRHEGTGEIAFVGVSGNASSQTIGLSFETIARPSTWVFRHRVAFVRNESNDALTAQSLLYGARAEKTLTGRASAFGEYGYFRDRFAGIANRQTIAGGLAAKIVARARHTLTADAGVGYLNEDRLAGEDLSDAIYTTGAKYVAKISETAELADEVALVGTFSRREDWRLAHTIAVTARLTAVLSLKVSNGVRYSRSPAPGFKRTDAITSVAVVAKFSRP